jgi:LysM repeat protein
VAALVVFLIPTLLFGGGDDTRTAAAPSPSVEPTVRPLITTAPVVATAAPTIEPSPSPTPRPETHRVRRGDTLTSIANRYGVKPSHIVCLNNMRNRNVVMLGVTYKIPPEGFRCPPGWRNQN